MARQDETLHSFSGVGDGPFESQEVAQLEPYGKHLIATLDEQGTFVSVAREPFPHHPGGGGAGWMAGYELRLSWPQAA